MKKIFAAIVAMMLAMPSFAQVASGGFELDKQNLYYGARMGLALEIPIVIKYGIKASDDIAVLPFLGPYFSYGIGGKIKDDDYEESSYNVVNHGDMGLKLGCGVEYDMLYLEAGYQFGIANIADGKGSIHSNALFINFGVNF